MASVALSAALRPRLRHVGLIGQLRCHAFNVPHWQSSGNCAAMPSMCLIGNPGSGKSSTVNCYLGEYVFKSGVSGCGSGITWQLDECCHNGRKFMDTPGLSDLSKRKQAAAAIDQVLKQGGSFNIVFVMTVESGRLKSDDLTTMKLVFDAVGDQIHKNSFAILVNKCTPKFLRALKPAEWIARLHTACTERNIPITRHIHFAPRVEALEDEEDVVVALDARTQAFLNALPFIAIDGEQVSPVNADAFEDMQRKMDELLAQVKSAEEDAKRSKEKVFDFKEKLRAEQAKVADIQERAAQLQKNLEAAAKEAEQASSQAEKAIADVKAAELQRQLLLAELELQRADKLQALRELEMAKKERKGGFYTLSLQMRATDWLGKVGMISGYDMKGIIAEMSTLVPPEIQEAAYSIEAAKSPFAFSFTDVALLGLLANKVGAFYLRDKDGQLIYTSEGAHHHFVDGSWVYSIDVCGEAKRPWRIGG